MLSDGLKYQDSRMATCEEMKQDLAPFALHDAAAKSKGGPVLLRDGDTVYTDPSDSHSLIVGDTGSMKTLRFVLPLIYSCAAADESMVIVDPKGELARKSESFLSAKGYKTVIINMRDPQRSPDTWNPMGVIERAYKSGEEGQQKAVLQLNDMLNDIFFRRVDTKDPYWNESAGQLALGICLLLLALGEKLNMKNLLKWRYEKLADGTLDKCFRNLPTDGEIYQNLAGYLGMTAENTKSCIRSTFDQLVRVFKSAPALTEMLNDTSFDIERIGEAKAAVFVVIPDEKTTFHFLATLFISQCYTTLLETAERHGGSLPRRTNIILEEFCNLPALGDIVPMITAARSRNIRLHMVIQSYGQLVEKYSENVSRAILDNCGNMIYLHTREMDFLTYISRLAGNNEYGRPLISTSRLQRLQKNETIIFHGRCCPYLAEEVPLIFDYPIKLGTELRSAPQKPKKEKKRRRIGDELKPPELSGDTDAWDWS